MFPVSRRRSLSELDVWTTTIEIHSNWIEESISTVFPPWHHLDNFINCCHQTTTHITLESLLLTETVSYWCVFLLSFDWLGEKSPHSFIHWVWCESGSMCIIFSLSLSLSLLLGKIKSHGHINNLRSNLCTFALDTPLIRQINRHR